MFNYTSINIIFDYLNKRELSINLNDDDIESLVNLCKHHALLPILYSSFNYFNIKLNDKISNYLKKEYQLSIYKTATQEGEKELVLNKLQENKIKCMPLKGSVLKYLYPNINERTMGDIDILYDEVNRQNVKKLLLSLGYTLESFGGNHDVYYKKPYIDIEMHRHLMGEQYDVLREYYNNIWNVIKPVNGNGYLYEMSNEDFYIFMIAHTSKHFSGGGIGLRYLIDLALYHKKYDSILNFDYINLELKKINLVIFNDKFSKLALDLYNGIKLDDDSISILNYVLESGTHGTISHSQAIKLTFGKDSKKLKKANYLFSRLFPSYKIMCLRNPILKKIPILLPFIYCWRILLGIFARKKLVLAEMRGLESYNVDKVNEIKKVQELSGIKM